MTAVVDFHEYLYLQYYCCELIIFTFYGQFFLVHRSICGT